MPKAVIIDYGVGNLFSLKCALQKVGFNSKIRFSSPQLKDADALILPGVGNFSAASEKLGPVKGEIIERVKKGIPIFGICLGMQLFFSKSEEGEGEGLALFQGENVRLPNDVKVPHMGWNTLRIVRQSEILDGISNESYVYFVHSLYPVPLDKDIVCAETEYGAVFASAIAKQNIYGTQFHPEKSGKTGLRILRNFAGVVKR
ncbi:MAG: imidazole glycerol phosphate synthase subunit HisH [Candidatus Bathycorpusculaceae bacterium]